MFCACTDFCVMTDDVSEMLLLVTQLIGTIDVSMGRNFNYYERRMLYFVRILLYN